jgi:peptidoglycan/xylan/chitin deacetylase (PgdA/CDA1 family)
LPARLITAAAIWLSATAVFAQPVERTVALTFDDLPFVGAPAGDLCDAARARALTSDFVTMLQALEAPATVFVNAGKVCEAVRDVLLPQLLDQWLDAGFEVGNHTLSHPNPNRITAEAYLADGDAGATVLRETLARRGRALTWYRHPYLMTGDTAEKKAAIAAGLAGRGYRIAPVTIDNSDWMFAAVYAGAMRDGDRDLMDRIGAAYVEYLDGVFAHFETYSAEVVGREPAQVLLLHANFLNRDHFPAVHAMLARRGYRVVPLEQAMADPVYGRDESYVGRAGVSWLHRWARTDGREVRWEPEVPDWIDAAYKTLEPS